MLAYVMVGTNDLQRSAKFYDAALAPLGLVRTVTRVLYRFPDYPLTPDQLLMLEEESTCEPGPFYETFDLTPVALDAGLAAILG